MPPEIQSYRFGNIKVDGESYQKDVIIFPDRVRSNWWREEGHSLVPVDLQEVFAVDADVLIIGQGAYGRMKVPQETRARIKAEGFDLVALNTKDAVETYNQRRDHERVIAALHLTC
ncbi:MAG: MTH938/NDUFAF3 family protein [Anaerolineales bacterium]|jgi:hypothetical protein